MFHALAFFFSMNDKLIELGTCKKPHGIKGEFSFHLFNSQDSILSKGSSITLVPLDKSSCINPSGEVFVIDAINFGNKTICRLKGVDNRNLVEEMIPFSIQVKRSEFPDLKSGEFYLSDLIGLVLIDAENKEVGSVENFFENGPQVILVIDYRGEKLELPYVPSFFPEIDVPNRKLSFIPPEFE